MQIKNTQIKAGSLKNEQIAADAAISLSKIAGGVELQTAVSDLQNDAFVTREVPSGVVNGSNAIFTLANTPVAGSEQVYLNGLLQDPGAGNSYTISGGTITFASAPLSGDEIHVSYATGDYMVAPGGVDGPSTKYTTQVTHTGSTSGTSYTINHNLNTTDIQVDCFYQNTGGNYYKLIDFYAESTGNRYGFYIFNITTTSVTIHLHRFYPTGGGIGETSTRNVRIVVKPL